MILVTGATGHLGQWVIADLTARGQQVLALSRHPLKAPAISGLTWGESVRSVSGDVSVEGGLDGLLEHLPRVTSVVHLAGFIPASTAANVTADALRTLAVNAAGTARLLALLAQAPQLRSVVYASTFEVYGSATAGSGLIAETVEPQPDNYYGASKLAGENYLSIFARATGVATAALRLPAVYGPGDALDRAIGNFIRASVQGTPIRIFGDGQDRRELVYAADAAEAIALALDADVQGPINIGSGRGFSIQEMADAVGASAGGNLAIERHGRVKPRVDFVMDVTRAREVLGWSPRTRLIHGVAAQAEWLRAGMQP